MTLRLRADGHLDVHIDESWNFANGPIAGRSCTSFREVEWTGPLLVARSLWANGSYVTGPEVGEPNIRILFRTDDDILIYLDYLVRVHLPSHTAGQTPAIMSGRLEVDEANERYRWLNRTQVVGSGQLDMDAKTQTYEMAVLRWDGDIGPEGQ